MRRLPGDLTEKDDVARMIRVNQAGEYGAMRIYAGQLAVLKNTKSAPVIRQMAEQEKPHLDYFNQEIRARNVRPTLMQPVWHAGGFLLGAATAMLGEKAAMACTVAVESVIDEHYAKQIARLDERESTLKKNIEKFREDEMHHHDTGLHHGAEDAPFYSLLSAVVRAQTKCAIWISERL